MTHSLQSIVETFSDKAVESPAPREHYTFGDGAVAADRLALLAAMFEPSSARLLRRLGYLQPQHAVDLGCGPGWSTRLVHALLAPTHTRGFESSPRHVARARELAPPGITYEEHDVSDEAFPGARPDFLYSRFLLTHLRRPEEIVANWGRASAEHAVLVIEETADMRSDHPIFCRYYEMVDELQAAHGQTLRVGAMLEGPFAGWTTEVNILLPLLLPAQSMARLHAMNAATWRHDAFARAAFDAAEVDQVIAQLTAIAQGITCAPPVRLLMRQLVLAK